MRKLFWILGVIAVFAIVGALTLQFAISRNGPAVLSAVDNLAGGSDGATLRANIATGEHPAQKIVIWAPEKRDPAAEPLPVLLFFHGGGWHSGDPVDYGFIGRSFVPKGFVVALAGYRLYPEAVYPDMLEDTARAIAWTHEEIAQYGGDPDRIVISGHSAGAYNVVQTALERQWLGRHGLSPDNIAGVVGLSGPYDFYPFNRDPSKNSFGKAQDPEATQPVNHIRADAPPMLLIHGEEDTIVTPRHTRELATRLESAGGRVMKHLYPGMTHNDPIISLAAPWRSSSDIDDIIVEFALSVGVGEETSVPVQGETR